MKMIPTLTPLFLIAFECYTKASFKNAWTQGHVTGAAEDITVEISINIQLMQLHYKVNSFIGTYIPRSKTWD